MKKKIPGKLDPSRIPDPKRAQKGKDTVDKLWDLVGCAVKGDDKNQILDPTNNN